MSVDPPINLAAALTVCRAKAHLYTAREVEFLQSISGVIGRDLTSAQWDWLQKLAEREPIDFEKINSQACGVLQALCARWLPNGSVRGREYVALNPLRNDNRPGSFRINLTTGRWADFADDRARGGDPISLAAYLFHAGDQKAAALDLKRMLRA